MGCQVKAVAKSPALQSGQQFAFISGVCYYMLQPQYVIVIPAVTDHLNLRNNTSHLCRGSIQKRPTNDYENIE
jgi:hypothetical protein